MSKKNKGNKTEIPSTMELVTDTVQDGINTGTAVFLLVVKFLITLVLIYISSLAFMIGAAYITVFFSSMLGVGYGVDTLDMICGTVIPGGFLVIFFGLVEFHFAKYLWLHLVQKSFKVAKDAITSA